MFIPIFIPTAGAGIDRYWKLALIGTITCFFMALITASMGLCPIENDQNHTNFGICETSTKSHLVFASLIIPFAILTLILKRLDK